MRFRKSLLPKPASRFRFSRMKKERTAPCSRVRPFFPRDSLWAVVLTCRSLTRCTRLRHAKRGRSESMFFRPWYWNSTVIPEWVAMKRLIREDPYLYSRIAEAIVRGAQGPNIDAPDRVVALMKHSDAE